MRALRALRTVGVFAFVATVVFVGPRVLRAAPQPAGPGRALTIEDYYRVQTVGNPSISPNGRWVTFTVSTRIEDSNNGNKTEAYAVRTDAASAPRKLLHDGKDVSAPRWTDDNWIQYGVDGQQWKIDPEQPSAAPVAGDARGGAVGRGGRGRGAGAGGRGGEITVASPDHMLIAHVREHDQPKPAPVYASDFEKRHAERFKGVIFDWKDVMRDGGAFPAPDPHARPPARIEITPESGGEAKTIADLELRPENLTWHPSGKLLAFTADSHWREELSYERPDLWTVTIDGTVTRLTDDGYVYSDLDFSPDGKYLSYARTYGTDMIIRQKLNHGGPRDLYVRPSAGGEPINLTAHWDLEPGPAHWSPDGRFIYFTSEIGGESHLFRVSVPGGQVEQVTTGERRLNGLTIDKRFKTIAYTVGLHESPGEVYAADIDGAHERRLTNVHEAIATEIAFSKADRLKWASHDGTMIEGWLMYPYHYDARLTPDARQRFPLIVMSHGGPHAATGYSFDFKKQYFAANGYFVLDTNFRSSTGYGDAFKWATWGEWGNKDGQDVISGIDYVLKRYPIDPKRVGHTGHSYGGFMTNWLITQYPDRFAAAITGAGITNWTSDYGNADIYRTKETEFYGTPWDKEARERMIKQSPLTFAGNVKTPTLFIHGEIDHRVPFEEGEQMYFALRRRGVPAKMIQYAGQPHSISGNWNVVHRMINELKWWETYLKPNPATTTTPSEAR
jgi:dipeptidyl aminopeptidase/acylaminoacyl peptidase